MLEIIFLATLVISIAAWFIVVFTVNPVLDRDFLNDRYFNPILRQGHPFFFLFRALIYAGAVISPRLAKRTMHVEGYDFPAKVGILSFISCWVLMIGMCIAFAYAIFYGVSLVIP
jgi:hypothetical protein